MENIRSAEAKDFERISEIEIFNYRLNFYPIFKDDGFYFSELSVSKKAKEYLSEAEKFFVYDDGAIKGFVMVEGKQIKKLFVEPVLQGNSIGAKLLDFAVSEKGADFLFDFGELRLLIEAKSALLKLDARQQVPNLHSANQFFERNIEESYKQLNRSFEEFSKKGDMLSLYNEKI